MYIETIAHETVIVYKLLLLLLLLLLFNRHCNACGVMACSTIVEYSQKEGFCRVPLPAARQTPQLGGPVIRTCQLPQRGVPHVWKDASEPQQLKVEVWARNFREFCRKWRLPRHFWVLLRVVNLRHGTDGFTSPPKKGALRISFARKIRRLRPGLNPRTWIPKASNIIYKLRIVIFMCQKL